MRGELCGLLIVLLDAVLCSAVWAGLFLLQFSSCGGLTGVWAFGAVRWAILYVFTFVLTNGKPQAVLSRFVAVLCLLPPVSETVRSLRAPTSEPYAGAPDLSMLLLGATSSSVACAIWEKGLCGGGRMRKDSKQMDAKQLFSRMLTYFRPDTLYLIAAFSFLILGVICESKTLICSNSYFLVVVRI